MLKKLLQTCIRWIRITFAVELHADSQRIRAATLAAILALLVAMSGSIGVASPLRLLAAVPINIDVALRTISIGWFEPEQTLPVTIVEIDEDTQRQWQMPAVTPRGELVTLIETVTASNPLAVIIDIDLSWGNAQLCDTAGEKRLRQFLHDYDRPAPLIFPKRVSTAANGERRAAASQLDDIFLHNKRLAWAHASFETNKKGTVRAWADWLEVCTDTGTQWLPAVAVRIGAMLDTLPEFIERPTPPPLTGSCQANAGQPTRLLLIGPRIMGQTQPLLASKSRAVSATLLLDPELARNDDALFGERIVIIGASHSGSGDLWLTPAGVLPGAELLANTVRYTPPSSQTGLLADIKFRFIVLLYFFLFVAAAWWLRGLVALLTSIVGALIITGVTVSLYNYYPAFEALKAALLLVIIYKAAQTVFNLVGECRETHGRSEAGWKTVVKTVCTHDRKPNGKQK